MNTNTVTVELTVAELKIIRKALFLLSAHYEDKSRYPEASFCDDIFNQLSEVITAAEQKGE